MPRPDFLNHVPPVGDPYVLGRWHKDRVHWRGYAREARTRLKAMVARGDTVRKMLILGRARSGTTLLVRLLDQVPGLRCEGEVLHYAVASPRRFLNDLAYVSGTPAYACKLLSYQLLEVHPQLDPERFLDSLAEDGFAFAHIVRSGFHQAISLSTAQSTGQYTRTGAQTVRRTRVRLDVDRFVAQIRWNAALLEFERALMRGRPHVAIDYDRDLTTPERQQSTVDRMCAALDRPTAPVVAPTKRIMQPDYAESIENLNAVLEALRRASLESFIPANLATAPAVSEAGARRRPDIAAR
jgi:hypothetical protein